MDYHGGSLSKALQDLFPHLRIDESKFRFLPSIYPLARSPIYSFVNQSIYLLQKEITGRRNTNEELFSSLLQWNTSLMHSCLRTGTRCDLATSPLTKFVCPSYLSFSLSPISPFSPFCTRVLICFLLFCFLAGCERIIGQLLQRIARQGPDGSLP